MVGSALAPATLARLWMWPVRFALSVFLSLNQKRQSAPTQLHQGIRRKTRTPRIQCNHLPLAQAHRTGLPSGRIAQARSVIPSLLSRPATSVSEPVCQAQSWWCRQTAQLYHPLQGPLALPMLTVSRLPSSRTHLAPIPFLMCAGQMERQRPHRHCWPINSSELLELPVMERRLIRELALGSDSGLPKTGPILPTVLTSLLIP